MARITSVAKDFFDACETGKGLGGLPSLLHADRELFRAGGAVGRPPNAPAIHGVDEELCSASCPTVATR